jgi:large subunit ribosomal protein L6
MSRVGNNPIEIPGDVQVSIEGAMVTAKGKLGELSHQVSKTVSTSLEEGKVVVRPVDDSKTARAMWGTTRSLLQSLVTGVSAGFSKQLEINGVGYRAAVQGSMLTLQLGYSHDIDYPIPEGMQRVGQVAAEIRSFRPPEPYKGKGIKYLDEVILRKEGKKK